MKYLIGEKHHLNVRRDIINLLFIVGVQMEDAGWDKKILKIFKAMTVMEK
jgi:hypothetical protein